jgi:GntR family histidine utilization transcriptional repressor
MTPNSQNQTLPAYEQVKAFIKQKITSGTWRPGDSVPSEASLQQQFGVSRMTVNRAVKELAVEGVVSRAQGSGTVVAQLHRISSSLEIRDIHDDILARGHVHSTQVLKVETVRASAALARIFRLGSGVRLFHSVQIHFEDGVAIQLEDRHVNPAAAPRYLQNDFAATTPTRYLLEHAPLTEASFTIEAARASAQESKWLNIGCDEPCLVMTRSTVSGQNVASLVRLVYPGTRHSFGGKFRL